MLNQPLLASVIDNVPSSLSKSSGVVRLGGHEVRVLFDSCSSESFIHPRLVNSLKLKVRPSSKTISMAASAFSTEVKGHTCVNITYQGEDYTDVRLGVLDHLCCDILLGIDFQAQHSSVVFKFGGNKTTDCLWVYYTADKVTHTVQKPHCRLPSCGCAIPELLKKIVRSSTKR